MSNGLEPVCRTCGHWGSYGDDDGPPSFVRGDRPDMGRCGAVGFLLTKDARAVAFGADPYERPMLLTAPDFGCSLWEQSSPSAAIESAASQPLATEHRDAYLEALRDAEGMQARSISARIGHLSRAIMGRLSEPDYAMENDPDYWRREALLAEQRRRVDRSTDAGASPPPASGSSRSVAE